MSIGSLATFGYATKALQVDAELEGIFNVNRRAVIVDIRYKPWCSWSSLWTRQGLLQRYGQRYHFKGDWLGNIHHRQREKGIQLAHPDQGVAWIIRQLEKGWTLILLCGCADYHTCHRKVVYELVRSNLHGRLPEFWHDQRVMTPDGPGTVSVDTPLDVQRARNRYSVRLDSPYQHNMRYSFPYELEPYVLVQQSLIA